MIRKIILPALIFLANISFAQNEVELVIPTGHTSQIQNICINQEATMVASTQNTEEIIVWNYLTGDKERVLKYHSSRVNDLLIDQNHLISGGDDSLVIIWNMLSKEIIATLNLEEPVFALLRETNRKLIVVGEQGKLLRWDYRNDIRSDSVQLSGKVSAASLSVDAERLIIATKDSVYTIEQNHFSSKVQVTTSGGEINSILTKSGQIFLGNGKGELITMDTSLIEQERTKIFDFRLYHIEESSAVDELILTGRAKNTHLKIFNTETKTISALPLDLGPTSLLSDRGIRTIKCTSSGLLLVPNYIFGISSFQLPDFKSEKILNGLSFPINDMAIDNNERTLAIASSDDQISLHDLSGVKPVKIIDGHDGGVSSLAFHPTDSLLASVGFDNKLKVWSVATGELTHSYDVRGKYVTTPIKFNVSGQYLIQKTDPDYFELYNLDKTKSKKLKIKDGIDYKFAQNGQLLIFRTRDGFLTYNAISFNLISKFDFPKTLSFDVRGKTIVVLTSQEVIYYDLNFKEKTRLKTPAFYDEIYLHPNEASAFATITSVQSGSSFRDYSLKYLKETKSEFQSLGGHQGFISNVKFLKKGRFIFSASKDGQIIIRDFADSSKMIASFIPLKNGEWVVLNPSGIYDASRSAYNSMHYARGKEIFDLAQLKDLYYEPKLLSRVLEYTIDPLPLRKSLSDLPSNPEVEIKHPEINGGILGLKVKNTGGGLSYVVIKINGKEVLRELKQDVSSTDSSSVTLEYPITGHPFIKTKDLNKVTVKAYNGDGSMSSPEKKLFVFGKSEEEENRRKPKLFSLMVGTDDYPGEALDLTYAGKDANDFADAMQIVGTNYYGEENTQIKSLNTRLADRANWPTKENIRRELERIEKEATAQDVLVVYLSGHGTNYGEDSKDFYYLTAEATGNMKDEENRKKATISSRELTEWIKRIPTLQQVLIVDACHSGKLTSTLERVESLKSSQIKALEQMKDRTGLYILAGSESDAVSYESSLYEQGLLTYSLLFGMKGATQDQNGNIDIIDLFQFVSKKVPELASEIGQIQMPEIKIPTESETFSIGNMRLEDQEKIVIIESKPIFIQSSFQEMEMYNDPILLGSKIDQLLLEESTEKSRKLVFLDKKTYPGGYTIRGRYQVMENEIKAEVKLYKGNMKIKDFTLRETNSKILAERIIEKVLDNL